MGAMDCSQLRVYFVEEIFQELREKAKEVGEIPDNVKTCLENEKCLGVEEIQWFHQTFQGGDWCLHELLSLSELRLPVPVEPTRNPELEARIQKLKAQQENREYKNMTKNVDNIRIYYPEDSISYQLKQINRQLIAVLQFVFSVGAGFTFGFLGLELIVGELEFGFRLLLGVMCSLIIALAEIYFLAKKLAEDYEPPPIEKVAQKPHQD